MRMRQLRLAISVFVLCFFVSLFLFPDVLDARIRAFALSSQFSPALASAGWRLGLAAAIILSAVWFGRAYCSVLCPAGLLQELFHRLGGVLRLRRLAYRPPMRQTTLLLVVAAAALLGVLFVTNILDPVGLFGRLAEPAGEAVSRLRGRGEIGGWDGAGWLALAAGAAALVVVPLFRGRWFCDRACPVGALLGLAAKLPGQRVRIDADACVSCGACERVCPTRCANSSEKNIEPSRCVDCLECAAACKFDAIGVGRREIQGRRDFLGSAIGVAAGGAYLASGKLVPAGAPFTGGNAMEIIPPGAVSRLRHRQRCVSCQACVTSCPVGIIRQKGADLRPVLDYDRGYCQYNCDDCLRSCPAGVFAPLSLEEKQATRIAATALLPEKCVVVTQGTECGACAEVCPTHAVRMVPSPDGGPTLPDFEAEYCIGCGACYHVCPAEPRAFRLMGLAMHEKSAGVRPGGHDNAPPPPSGGELMDFPF